MNKKNITNQKGQMFILAILILGLVIVNSLIIINNSITFDQGTHYSSDKLTATNLAEAGIDKAIASLNATGGTYEGESGTTLGPGQFDVAIAGDIGSAITLTGTGYIPNKTKPRVTKKVKVKVSQGIGTSFFYAIQVGVGGFVMGAGSKIQGSGVGVPGSVYSNGNISVSGSGASITGDAYAAGGVSAAPDVTVDCSASCSDGIVGNGNTLDVAQSFRPTVSGYLPKVLLNLQKFKKPPDIKVYLLGDLSTPISHPNKDNVLASGTLHSSQVIHASYFYTTVDFDTPPYVVANTKYWIMMETSNFGSDNVNYWYWQAFTTDTYFAGEAKISVKWNDPNPVWSTPPYSGDLNFKTYMASGTVTSIQGFNAASKLTIGDGSCTNGKPTAHANTLANLNVDGDYYYATSAASVSSACGGVGHNLQPDPGIKDPPISDADISQLKTAATNIQVINLGGISTLCPPGGTISAGKYKGSVELSGCNISLVSSPVWITGHFYLGNGSTIKLDSSIGNKSGFVMVGGCTSDCGTIDSNAGKISFGNTDVLSGDGQPNSYMTMISNFDSTGGASDAIAVGNGLTTTKGVLYSNKGNINIQNNNTITGIYGYKVNLGNNVIVSYEEGLSTAFLYTGPGGSYTFIKGTYQQP